MQKTNALIVGAGKGGTALVELLHQSTYVNIFCVVDTISDSPGIVLAKRLGIPTASDFKEIIKNEAIDEIINVTGREDIQTELLKLKLPHVGVIGGHSAKFVWSLIEETEIVKRILEQHSQFLDAIIESLPYPFLVVNVHDYTIQMANSAARSSRASDALTCYGLTHGKDKPCQEFKEVCPLEIVKTTKKSAVVEHIHKDKEGSQKHFEVHAFPMFDKQGKLEQVIEYIIDITQRKQAEDKIKQMAKEWENTFNAISDLISIQDREGRLLRINKAFADTFGLKVEDCIGRYCYNLVHQTDKCLPNCPQRKTLEGKKTQILELFDLRLDKYLEITTCPIFDMQGEVVNIVHIIKDVTERKKIQELKDEFLSVVSHELRTPLTTIREAVSQVLDGILGETTEQQREFLNICLQDVDRLMRIINGLLDTSKIEARKMELKREIVDITSLIKRVISSFMPRLKEKHLEIKTNFFKDDIEIDIDRDKIIQVVTNLLGNALKFTDSGTIEIIVEDKGEWIECAMSDTGRGIAKDELPKLFHKFQQFGREYGPGEKGTGLGLAITKGIIGLHHGKIWAESELGKGTKLIFTLPKSYSIKEMMHEIVDVQLEKVKGTQQEYAILVIRMDNYLKLEENLGKQKIKELFIYLSQVLEQIVSLGKMKISQLKNEFILTGQINKKVMLDLKSDIIKEIKQAAFEFIDEEEVIFSSGMAFFPADGSRAMELLEKAYACMVSEEKERLVKQIMLVDDDSEVIKLLKDALKEFGYQKFNEACDGQQALQQIEAEIPDLLILDMKMPHMSGYEVVGRLKENIRTEDLPILIMSGYKVEYEKFNEYVREKAILVLSKPIDLMRLKRFVAYLL